MLKSAKIKNFKDEKEDFPLDKLRGCKNIKEYLDKRYKINHSTNKDSLKEKLSLSFNPDIKNTNKFFEKCSKTKQFTEDNFEDLTIELKTSSNVFNDKDSKHNKQSKMRNSFHKAAIPSNKNTEMVFLSDDERPSRLSQLSLKKSKYISSQKSISSIKLSKGNIMDHVPKSIICGYQTEKGKKIYMIDWHNTDDTVTLPTLIPGELLKEKYTSLIVDYLENIIVKH